MATWDDILTALGATWPARLANTAIDAAKLPGDVYQGRVAPDSDEAIRRAADLAGFVTGGSLTAPAQRNATGMGIRAYHGSPYDFEKFDLSKIGTGEGAQAYGHGLYFAENPAVAEEYKRQLANKIVAHPDELGGAAMNPGKMYEVNINARPEQFLDWEKSLGQQPEVFNALQGPLGHRPDLPGAAAYERLGLGNDPAASQKLSEAGIPGIKYLDQGSRIPLSQIDAMRVALERAKARGDTNVVSNLETQLNAPQTSNYVVFNPAIVDILKKYGLAGMLGGGAAASMQGQQAPYFGE